MTSPCYKCKKRTVDPNCHDETRCEEWRAFRAKIEQASAAQREAAMLEAANNLKAIKASGYKGIRYEKGDARGIWRAEREKRYIQAKQEERS